MPVGDLKYLTDIKPSGERLLCMDIGQKTIGLALSNTEHSISTPYKTIDRKKLSHDFKALKDVIYEYSIGGYILGFPLNMDGTKGAGCDRVLSFADEMLKNPQIFGDDPWIGLWDERLSTVSVEGLVDGLVDKRKAKEKGVIDKLAAHHILQGALEYLEQV
jgi:putative Holliday junction resolvase